MNDAPSPEEISQFVIDAGNGDTTPMETFVEKYWDHIDARDRVGDTALTWSIIREEAWSVSYLLSHGASVNAPGKSGRTPIFYAIIHRNLALMDKLIEKGADINCVDDSGCTPLMQAALCGVEGAVTRLLGKGANPMCENAMHKTAAQVAAEAGHAAIAVLLEQACAPYRRAVIDAAAHEAANRGLAQVKNRAGKKNPFKKGNP